ncbi:DUF5979 domain-containing protein [Corynebacterium kutscheri]|nr:DUF5979 domain-containing protein [Corynebacterium kutscheri]
MRKVMIPLTTRRLGKRLSALACATTLVVAPIVSNQPEAFAQEETADLVLYKDLDQVPEAAKYQRYPLTWHCHKGEEYNDYGTVRLSPRKGIRFKSIPKGASCTVTEDTDATAVNGYTQTIRWWVNPGGEAKLQTPDQPNQISFTLNSDTKVLSAGSFEKNRFEEAIPYTSSSS